MSVIAEIKREFEPKLLLPSLTVGALAGVMDIGVEISLAALIFADVGQFLAGGIGLMLFGALVIGIVVSLTTSLPGMIGVPQDTPAAILALAVSGIALSMKSAAPQAVYATVLAAITVTSLTMGLIFLLLGRFQASGFVRYIPYPVVGGFLAGTGWLLARGGMSVMLNTPLDLAAVPALFGSARLFLWLPGLVFGVALLLVLRRYDNFLITPGALLLLLVLFYGYLLIARIPLAEASARGWLLGPFPAGGFYQPLTPAALPQVDWLVILGQADKIVTVMVLSVIALLLNTSGLEITVRRDIDLNRELMTAGFANLVGGLGGSPVGYQALGMSSLAYRLGARSRLVNIVAGSVCGVALLFGASLFSYVPKLLLGGMLLYLGLTFLVEWLVDARRALPIVDYALVWVILAVIVAVGFLQGIAVGVAIAAVLFVITYSRVNIVRNTLTGECFHSNVDRPKQHRDLLARHGSEIYILRLQGFIFFGTIQAVLNQIRGRLVDTAQPRLEFVVLDFQRVTRLDSSAVFGITRLKQLTESNGVPMVWTQVSPTIHRQMQRGGLLDESDGSFIILPTLDHGVEWCENRILERHGDSGLAPSAKRLEEQLERGFPGMEDADRLVRYLQRMEIPAGQYLMREGDPPSDMYFIESGMLTAQLEGAGGELVRLRSMRGGTTVGEMGLYLGAPRTASVIASEASVVFRLSEEALNRMRREDPDVAAALHEWIARMLAERLAANNRTIEALMD
ncbi:MAG: SLC26A/SulP transporter family protein [Anaerolineales bacterium]